MIVITVGRYIYVSVRVLAIYTILHPHIIPSPAHWAPYKMLPILEKEMHGSGEAKRDVASLKDNAISDSQVVITHHLQLK